MDSELNDCFKEVFNKMFKKDDTEKINEGVEFAEVAVTEQNLADQIAWKDLTDFVELPVYNSTTGKWHILHGYKQYGNHKEVFLSDEKSATNFDEVVLCKENNLDKPSNQESNNLF